MPSDKIEKILEPKRLVRVFGKIFLAIVLFFALIVGVKMAVNTMNSVEVTSHDHTWFKAQIEEISSLERRIVETRQALVSHKEEVDDRWISRSDDRAQTTNLTQKLLSLEENRSELVREYNVAADLASDKILRGLPPSVIVNKKVNKESDEHED